MEPPKPMPKHRPSIAEGVALIVVGLVIFVPSGLCTGVLFVAGITSSNLNSILVPLVIGGPFVFGGGVLLWTGFKKLRGIFRKSDAPDQF